MNGTLIDQLIEQALLKVHTGFCAKVISANGNGNLATIQPLNMIKAVGGAPKKQAVIPNCPVLDNAVKFTSLSPVTVRRVQPGDTVYCICADRDISETRTGSFATPVLGHHMLSGAVVVGIL